MSAIRIGPFTVEASHRDKVLFPDWIGRVSVEKEDGRVTHVVCENEATLVYLASQNVVTPHVWLSRADRPHYPDRLIFDLDPSGDDPGSGSGAGFGPVRQGARAVRGLLEAPGLAGFVMTTGSRGLHVLVPLDRQATFDAVRAFARDVAEVLARRYPDVLTVELRKEKRQGRVFLDTLRNAYGQTAVPPPLLESENPAPYGAQGLLFHLPRLYRVSAARGGSKAPGKKKYEF